MAKFCKHCGTQLEEGQLCTCPQAQAEAAQQPVQQAQPVPPPQPAQPQYAPPQQAPAAPSPVGAAFKNVLPFFKAYMHSPVNATRTAIAHNDLILAVILLAIQAIAAGLMIFSLLSKVCGAIKSLAFGMLGGYRNSSSLFGGPNIAPSFLMSLIFGVLAAVIAIAIFAVLVFAVAKIMKSACSFKDVIIACGANSLFVTVLLLLSFIFFFLSIRVGIVIFVLAMLAWIAMGVPTAQAVSPNTELGKFWISFIIAVLISLLLGGWVSSKFFGMSVGAIKVSANGESHSVNEMIDMAGGFQNIMENIVDEIF